MPRTKTADPMAALFSQFQAFIAAQSGETDEAPAARQSSVKTGGKTGPKQLTTKHQIRGGQLKALQARLKASDLDYDAEVKVTVTIGGKSYSNWSALSKLIASL